MDVVCGSEKVIRQELAADSNDWRVSCGVTEEVPSSANEKKRKKGRARKKKEGTNGPDPLMIIAMFWLDSTHNKCSQVLYTLCIMA